LEYAIIYTERAKENTTMMFNAKAYKKRMKRLQKMADKELKKLVKDVNTLNNATDRQIALLKGII
jgi:flagellar hook-associated protein FlgK